MPCAMMGNIDVVVHGEDVLFYDHALIPVVLAERYLYHIFVRFFSLMNA